MRGWEQILTGTAERPGREFYQFIYEFTGNYDRLGSGIPFGYTKPNSSYGICRRDSWITDAQAGLMEHALSDLRKGNPFAYRVFWKRYFSSIPLRDFRRSSRLCKELREVYGWDGTEEELKWQLGKALSFLFKRLEVLVDGK